MNLRFPSTIRSATAASLVLAITLSGCASVEPAASGDATKVIRGNVVYRDKVAMPADAELVMRLVDISDPRKPVVVAENKASIAGKQVPIPFSLPIDPAKATGETNALRATIRYDGKIQFVTGARVVLNPSALPEMVTMGVVKGDVEPNAGDPNAPMSGPVHAPTRDPNIPRNEKRRSR